MADIHNIEDSPAKKNSPINNESGPMSKRRYSSDEVADIIRISLQDEAGNSDNTIDHEELIAIGKDVGVSDDQIDRAINRLEQEYRAKDKESVLWSKFKAHFVMFASLTALCVLINLITGTQSLWSGYVFLSWGLFLIGHYAGLRYAPEFVQMTMDKTWSLAQGSDEQFNENDLTVLFKISDASGLIETEGMLTLEDDELRVEYQTYDAVLGLLKASVKEVVIPRGDITSALIEHKLWSTVLVIKGRSLKMFKGIPGSSSGSIRLKVDRSSQLAASHLAKSLSQ